MDRLEIFSIRTDDMCLTVRGVGLGCSPGSGQCAVDCVQPFALSSGGRELGSRDGRTFALGLKPGKYQLVLEAAEAGSAGVGLGERPELTVMEPAGKLFGFWLGAFSVQPGERECILTVTLGEARYCTVRLSVAPGTSLEEAFRRRDVMVGVLRNREQLELNLRYRFYHIPAGWVQEEQLPVRYLALYQSAQLFPPDRTGVRLYGKVASWKVLRRGEIDEIPKSGDLNRLYYRFAIERWEPLERPVRPGAFAPRVNLFTSLYQLRNCATVPELFLEEPICWELLRALKVNFSDVHLLGEDGALFGICFGGHEAIWGADQVEFRLKKRPVLRYRWTQIREAGVAHIIFEIKTKLARQGRRFGFRR